MSTAYKPPVRKWSGVGATAIIAPVADVITYIIKVTGTATFDVSYTLDECVQGIATLDSTTTLTFSDVDPDTIVRSKGSWIADRFKAGMTVAITGTTSNNSSYLIDTVTEDTLTLDAGAAATDETVTDSSGVSMIADIPTGDWFDDHQVIDAAGSEFVILEWGPTGIKFTRASGAGTADIWIKS